MSKRIDGVERRKGLKPRREPYWAKLSKGHYLGFRKMTPGSEGTWVARYRQGSGQQAYKALGEFSEHADHERYDRAKAAAEDWARHMGIGGSNESLTVKQACERYVQKLRNEGKEDAADEAAARFKRYVYLDVKLAARELSKLQKPEVEIWRQTLRETPIPVGSGKKATLRPRSNSALNRDMTTLRAALNQALRDRLVTSSFAWEDALKPVKNADKRRSDYLDKRQRQRLLAHTEGAITAFLTGLCLVPIRPGALAALRASEFDVKLKTLAIGKDKQGKDRKISLPDSTARFFAEQGKGKLPTAPLLANESGGHWTKDEWKYPVKASAKAAKLPDAVTAYTLRHSVITDLVHDGLDTLTVAQLSGTSVAMIERHYGHLTAKRSREALATLAI